MEGFLLVGVLLGALILPLALLFCHRDTSEKTTKNQGQHPVEEEGPFFEIKSSNVHFASNRYENLQGEEQLPLKQTQAADNSTTTWRCACEGGFFPPGMFGNTEAVLRMGSGQCYHKQ